MAKERCPYSHVQTGDVFHARQEELMNVVAEGSVVETPHVGAKVYIQITNVRTPEQVPSIVTTHFLLQIKGRARGYGRITHSIFRPIDIGGPSLST